MSAQPAGTPPVAGPEAGPGHVVVVIGEDGSVVAVRGVFRRPTSARLWAGEMVPAGCAYVVLPLEPPGLAAVTPGSLSNGGTPSWFLPGS
jgi:hypothetical protein